MYNYVHKGTWQPPFYKGRDVLWTWLQKTANKGVKNYEKIFNYTADNLSCSSFASN